MKKRRMLCALCLLLGLMMLCSGCEKKESADDYLGRLITRAKENEGELQSVLETGIADAKSSNDFVIDFPDELKESYCSYDQRNGCRICKEYIRHRFYNRGEKSSGRGYEAFK